MRSRAKRSPGFTLVELMVSLVAGLVIAMAVVGLAKATTNTFHEEARMSVVESSVRLGAERLRADLSRIGFMSTGNIVLARDSNTAGTVPAHMRIATDTSIAPPTGSRYNTTDDLAGLRIFVGGSGAAAGTFPGAGSGSQGPLALATVNGLNPDAIVITGNFTTSDLYQGTLYEAPDNLSGSCGSQSVLIKQNADAATRRLLNQPDPRVALRSAFQPVPATRFLARVVDPRGCEHYVVVCNVTMDASAACSLGDVCAAIHFEDPPRGGSPRLPVLPADPPAGSTIPKMVCGANKGEPVSINPVHRFRYYIGPNNDPLTALDPAGIENAGNKFNLYRDMLDASNPPTPLPVTRQVMAEFAVDLKFGLTVSDPVPPNLKIFDMDSDLGGGAITQWTQPPTFPTVNGGPGPQRVRTLRFRLATRSALPDRHGNLLMPAPAPYMVRYCTNPPDCADPVRSRYARVRTIVSEVTLTNQLGMTY
ncbi:MAG: prepilin-type N-terminal cleavage/methylation domain-containing protein [Deltaproteobacteria bacterium]|nr:prepilin-type N-terminal cleavage/methylation domain-containing protein [Deltaproteobacteria bacterium]